MNKIDYQNHFIVTLPYISEEDKVRNLTRKFETQEKAGEYISSFVKELDTSKWLFLYPTFFIHAHNFLPFYIDYVEKCKKIININTVIQ